MSKKRGLPILLQYLERGKTPPFDWVVEYASDGTLQATWDACVDAFALMSVYARAEPDRRLLVLAACACACARRVLRCIPKGDARPREALRRAEAWARGHGSDLSLREARASASAATDEYNRPIENSLREEGRLVDRADASAATAVHAAVCAATCANKGIDDFMRVALEDNCESVYYAATSALALSTGKRGAARRQIEALAKAVRRVIPVAPSLDRLITAG